MANRKQRRANKRLMNKPEMKKYVDQFCMEISNILIEGYEAAKKDAERNNTKIDLTKVQGQVESAMKIKGEELGKKVQEIVRKHQQPGIKTNIRAKIN